MHLDKMPETEETNFSDFNLVFILKLIIGFLYKLIIQGCRIVQKLGDTF